MIHHPDGDNVDETNIVQLDNFERLQLNIKQVFERRYLIDGDNHSIFQYEVRCNVGKSQNQQNAVYHNGNDQAAFMNFSRLIFQGNELIGLKEDSLQIFRKESRPTDNGYIYSSVPQTNRGNTADALNHFTIDVDQIENALLFEYSFDEHYEDIEISFIILLKNQLEFNLTTQNHLRILESAHQYQGPRNARIHGMPPITMHEHFGYNRDTISHLLHDSTSLANFQPGANGSEMDIDGQNFDEFLHNADIWGNFGMPAGSSTKQNSKTTTFYKRKTKHPVQNNTVDTADLPDTPSSSGLFGGLMKRGTNYMTNFLYEKVSVQSKKARTDETRPEIATIIIEIHRMPALMVEMDKRKTILDLKKLCRETMVHSKITPFEVEKMRVLVSQKEASNDLEIQKISEIEQQGENASRPIRIALVTKQPSLPATFEHRDLNQQLTEQQKAAYQQLNTLRILMRNVKACNSNASERLNPRTRTRFNYPETPTEHNVTSVDLGHVIMELAAQVRQYSENLMRLGDQMIKDRPLNPEELRSFQMDIQNCMDLARYASPMFKSTSNFVVPVARCPPRLVSVINPN